MRNLSCICKLREAAEAAQSCEHSPPTVHCNPEWNPRSNAIRGLSLLFVLAFPPRVPSGIEDENHHVKYLFIYLLFSVVG